MTVSSKQSENVGTTQSSGECGLHKDETSLESESVRAETSRSSVDGGTSVASDTTSGRQITSGAEGDTSDMRQERTSDQVSAASTGDLRCSAIVSGSSTSGSLCMQHNSTLTRQVAFIYHSVILPFVHMKLCTKNICPESNNKLVAADTVSL